ncbi:HAMP domain-containing histidine kinase [Paenibacillus sp. J5C_2022]|uniref:sensor histidine kinase n=1 Tax=Paenibacillus sp. J5C2022 TaxID=2977129 RepID=UPI0021CE1CF1|nr:HAMP domain-containing sensor histidine kinase [Paenibacillus sp. J5C2022]MCU6710233.1 HAMP domain-containing histidine kinase [Paenibacillus sp. J5C2022]
MVYTILLLTLFSFFLMIRSYRNRYAWLLVLMVAGLNMVFLGMIMNVVKGGTYKYPESMLFFLDYKLYLYLSSLNMNYYDTYRLQNWGSAIYLFSIPQFVSTFIFDSYRSSKRWKGWLRYSMLAIPPFFYVICYSPDTRFVAYQWMTDSYYGARDLTLLLYGMDSFHILWMLLYLFFPIFLLCKHIARTNISLKQKQTISLAVTMGLLNLLFISVFAVGPFKQFYMSASMPEVLIFPSRLDIPAYYFHVMPVVMLLAVQAMIVILIKFRGIDATSFFTRLHINRNVSNLNANLRGVFHSFKNTMFTVKILAEQAEIGYGSEEGLNAVKRLQQIGLSSLNHTAKVLDSLREIKVRPIKVNVAECVELALEKSGVPGEIDIRKRYRARGAHAYADQYQLIEALVNLFTNAAEAIQAAKRENGYIFVEVAAEQEWVFVKIVDNGIGIGKKEKKRIFTPLYSTKSRHENWGVGLSYVYRVIEAHLGFITVESERGKYTSFEIMLPIAARREEEAIG